MAVLSLLLFALSGNLDNLVIGLAYGMRGIRIRLEAGVLISGMVLAGTAISMALGQSLLCFLPLDFARFLGSAVMIGLGLGCLWNVWKNRKEPAEEEQWPSRHPEQFDKDGSRHIDWKESLALGSALALNNVGLGLGAGAVGLRLVPACIAVFCVSLGLLYGGNFLGRKRRKKDSGRNMEALSGVLMLLLGAWEFFL